MKPLTRRLLLEEVADALEQEAARLYRDGPLRPGEISIEHINGIEMAASHVRQMAQPEPDDLIHVYVYRTRPRDDDWFGVFIAWIFEGGYEAHIGTPANPPFPGESAPIAHGRTPGSALHRGIKAAQRSIYGPPPPLRDVQLPTPPWWGKK